MKKTTETSALPEVHNEYKAPVYNINIGYVDKQINGDYIENYHVEGAAKENEATSDISLADKPAARRKVLFVKDNSQFVENVETKRREAQRLKAYLARHKMSGCQLSAEKANRINEVVAAFIGQWNSEGLLGDEVCGTALFRFLTEEVGLTSSVQERAYGNIVKRVICNMEVDPITKAYVEDAFREK